MSVVRLEVVQRESYADAAAFGDVGPYERIDAVAHYAVDPAVAANANIVGLADAARDSEGRVAFSGDVVMLRPVVPDAGNRVALTLMLELRRRGGGLGAAALCGGGGQGDAILLSVAG